jgi:hypothetical protein
MDIHPWTKHDIVQARHEERVLRGLAAYEALRGRSEQPAESVAGMRGGRIRILDRLRRRDVGVTGSATRPVV